MSKVTLVPEISHYQMAWRNDPKVNAWTRQNGILSAMDMKRWFEQIDTDPSIKMFGIAAASTGEDVGTCGLTSIRPVHGTAEFSLLIAPDHHKKGYGKAALIELLKYGFKHMRLNCIWGETIVGNHALEMFKNVGFHVEGQLTQRYFKNGKYVDSISVSILRENAECQIWFI